MQRHPQTLVLIFFISKTISSHFIVHKKCKKINVSLINTVITYGSCEKTILSLIAIYSVLFLKGKNIILYWIAKVVFSSLLDFKNIIYHNLKYLEAYRALYTHI